MEYDERKIIFYDGECMLCNRLIRFIMNKDIADIYFSPLQSPGKWLANLSRLKIEIFV